MSLLPHTYVSSSALTRSGKNPPNHDPPPKSTSPYVFFVITLVGLRHELVGSRAFGIDGEKALADGFSHEFHYAIHLTCFIHCCRNIKSQLQLLGYPECVAKKFLKTSLGVSMGIHSLKACGLL